MDARGAFICSMAAEVKAKAEQERTIPRPVALRQRLFLAKRVECHNVTALRRLTRGLFVARHHRQLGPPTHLLGPILFTGFELEPELDRGIGERADRFEGNGKPLVAPPETQGDGES